MIWISRYIEPPKFLDLLVELTAKENGYYYYFIGYFNEDMELNINIPEYESDGDLKSIDLDWKLFNFERWTLIERKD